VSLVGVKIIVEYMQDAKSGADFDRETSRSLSNCPHRHAWRFGGTVDDPKRFSFTSFNTPPTISRLGVHR
jgi:hypothetical protein